MGSSPITSTKKFGTEKIKNISVSFLRNANYLIDWFLYGIIYMKDKDRTLNKAVFKMKPIKTNVCEFEGYAVTVDIEGNVEEYAKSFLHIFNNVRESSELFKVRNYYDDNCVTVYCELDSKDALIKYLKAFGEIKSCEMVIMYRMEEPNFNIDKYYDAILVPDFD